MSEYATIWQQTADKWTEVADLVSDADWAKPTPCDGFTVRELVDHAMSGQVTGGRIIGADTAPGEAWSEVRRKVAAALADPTNLDGVAESFGGMPKQHVMGLLTTDLLIHAWDLARSIGADDTLPPDAVAAATIGFSRMPQEMMRREGMFGPAVEISADASAQDKMIAFAGRQP